MADESDRVAEGGSIEFHYQKTSQYRGIHADGFWGGITPRGTFAVSFFSERQPIPRHVVRRILSSQGETLTAGPEETTDSLKGIVRQVEATLYMDFRTMQEFYVWLGGQVQYAEEAFKVPDGERVAKANR